MSEYCDGVRIPDAWSVKLIFSLIVDFYLTKNKNRTKKSLHKNADFSKNNWKVYFRKLNMCVYLRNKFQVASIILTSFRQGAHPPPLPK